MSMRAHSPMTGIVWLEFDTQEEVCLAMMRLQEFYESPYPQIQGQHVDVEKFARLYAADQPNGQFTYCEDWNGFNIPGPSVDAFYEKHEDQTAAEVEIAYALTLLVPPDAPYYVIATHKGESEFDHELAHALWFLCDEYRADACARLIEMPARARGLLATWLREHGYADAVINDEVNAYLATTDREWFFEEFGTVDGTALWLLGDPFRTLFAAARVQQLASV